jgi:hypothetical protein
MRSNHVNCWMAACRSQHAEIVEMKAYKEVEWPAGGVYILPGKWVFTLKLNKENFIKCFKACWVICSNH